MKTSDWHTPIEKGELNILSVSWSSWDWYTKSTTANNYNICNSDELDSNSLEVIVMHNSGDLAEIYKLVFSGVGAYRLLGEHGLPEIFEIGGVEVNTFKVRGNGWSKESPSSFYMHTHDGWSYMLATGDECVEVLCSQPPNIIKLQSVSEAKLT